MKNFIVIGNPIEHSLSPDLHNWIFKKLKINAIYNKILCNEIDIISQIKNDKINGINVTLPFKETIINFVDEINLRVKSIGSVNCIVKNKNKLIGYNTDWYGFSKLINNNKVDIQNKEVIVIGAGGVSRAVIFSLIQMRVKKIKIFNRSIIKAKKLENNIIKSFHLDEINDSIKDDSIIINCTSIGMINNDLPILDKLISANQTIIDTIYNPYKTELLKLAQSKGAKIVNGMDMFIYQAIASLELWLNDSIGDKLDYQELRKYLKEILC